MGQFYSACGLFIGLVLCAGCSPARTQLNRCQNERQQLARQLDEERRLRETQEGQVRDLGERLAESEKELARIHDQSLADRPATSRTLPRPIPFAPTGDSRREPAPDPAPKSGWRPTQ